MSDTARPRLTRRRLLAGGAGLAAAPAGGGGFAVGRAGRDAPADPPAAPAALRQFLTRPDLVVPVVDVTVTGPTAPGLVLFTPAAGAGGRGPLLVDGTGQPVWFHQVTGPEAIATDARVQRLAGQPVLTSWEGTIDPRYGAGAGEFVVVDRGYREIRRLRAPGPVPADRHDLILTPQGTAIFFAYEPAAADLSAFGSRADGSLVDGVLYEIDVATGTVRWQWRGRDHIALDESYAAPTGRIRDGPADPGPSGLRRGRRPGPLRRRHRIVAPDDRRCAPAALTARVRPPWAGELEPLS